jgi:two-component system, NarL family, sensor histidine kinase EvgS
MVHRIAMLIFLQFLVSGLFSCVYSSQVPEKLIISHNLNNAPFKFVDNDGGSEGLLIEVWRLWSIRTGIPVEFKAAQFEETVDYVKNGSADINSGLFRTPEREKYLDFTNPILKLEYYMFADASVDCRKITKNEVEAYRIGVPKGFTHDFALKEFPGASLEIFEDFPSLYKACFENRIKVFISPIENLEYYLETTGEENRFSIILNGPVYSMEYLGAVKKGNAELLSTINNGLEKISPDEIESIRSKWNEKVRTKYSFKNGEHIELTEKERLWLSFNPDIIVTGDPEWPPNSMYDKAGNYVGIVADLWDLVEKKSGVDFRRVRSESWSQAVNNIREGKITVLDCVSRTPERDDFMEFTQPFFTSNIVMIGREDLDYINGIYEIKDLSVAVQEGVSEIELIKRDYPGLKLAFYSDVDMAYRDVSTGRVDLFLRHQSDFSYTKKEKMLTNLKIVGPTEYSREYMVGVAKGNKELVSILNKSIDLINHDERNAIFEKWHGRERSVIDYSLVWKVLISALLIMGIFFYWNRTLSKEIALRKKAQIELEEAMLKVKEATEAKSRFLANMSHEIRTPMNAVLGFTDLLKKTPLNTVQENYVNTIRSGGTTLLNIINDILDISKIEANKLDINYSYFDLNSLIFDLRQFFDEKIRQKNIELSINFGQEVPKIVFLDELRIRQIFFNLVSNAIKFTDNGSIKIIVSSVVRNNGHIDLNIEVQDSGCGIKYEDRERIFEAFEQAGDHAESKKFQGTGLGLAITKRLVELMNGKINVESEPGKGSSFVINFYDVRFDADIYYKRRPAGDDLSNISFSRAKVLIADDIESNRLLLCEMCRSIGLETLEAADGKMAVEMAKLHVPDIILLDIRMPVMNGYEAVSIIKGDEVLKKIPVIAVTASVMNNELIKMDKNKFDAYIRKPVAMDELILQLKNFIEHRVGQASSVNDELIIEEISDKEKLLQLLRDKIRPEIDNAKLKHNFSHIKNTASEMKIMAEEHGSKKLGMYAEKLHRSVSKYDIEEIKIYLDNFDDLLENIENNGKES